MVQLTVEPPASSVTSTSSIMIIRTGRKAVTMTPDGPQAATAEVVFTNHGRERRQTLKLVKEGPMWRIADIIDDKGKSLHDDLMAIAEKAES